MRKHHPHIHPAARPPHDAGVPLWHVGSWFLPAYWATVLLLALLLWLLS
jgi:hypothetical protein